MQLVSLPANAYDRDSTPQCGQTYNTQGRRFGDVSGYQILLLFATSWNGHRQVDLVAKQIYRDHLDVCSPKPGSPMCQDGCLVLSPHESKRKVRSYTGGESQNITEIERLGDRRGPHVVLTGHRFQSKEVFIGVG